MSRHEFRRTSLDNMERRGVPRSVVTAMTVQKAERVYRRYDIILEPDRRDAVQKGKA